MLLAHIATHARFFARPTHSFISIKILQTDFETPRAMARPKGEVEPSMCAEASFGLDLFGTFCIKAKSTERR